MLKTNDDSKQTKKFPAPREEFLAHLGELSFQEYYCLRSEASKTYSIPVGGLDKIRNEQLRDQDRKKLSKQKEASHTIFDNISDWEQDFPEWKVIPWEGKVNGTELFDEIIKILKQFVILEQDDLYEAVAIWIMATWCRDYAKFAPILMLTAGTNNCGKTTLAKVLNFLVPRPYFTSNVSPAVLYHIADTWHPTLIIDECDTFLSKNSETAGILNF